HLRRSELLALIVVEAELIEALAASGKHHDPRTRRRRGCAAGKYHEGKNVDRFFHFSLLPCRLCRDALPAARAFLDVGVVAAPAASAATAKVDFISFIANLRTLDRSLRREIPRRGNQL